MSGEDLRQEAWARAAERDARAAPRQPDGEGLEVVAWFDTQNKGYLTDDKDRASTWAHEGFSVGQLCRLSDAQRVIAELREECGRLREVNRIQLEVATVHGAACVVIRKQRDKLAGLLKLCANEFKGLSMTQDLPSRIEAALAEVDK